MGRLSRQFRQSQIGPRASPSSDRWAPTPPAMASCTMAPTGLISTRGQMPNGSPFATISSESDRTTRITEFRSVGTHASGNGILHDGSDRFNLDAWTDAEWVAFRDNFVRVRSDHAHHRVPIGGHPRLRQWHPARWLRPV